jgi:hypothetical protein
MGMHEFFEFQKVLLQQASNPLAWLLRANPVWGRYEDVNRIALFDTKEAAERYLEAAVLPKLPEGADRDIYKTADGYWRSFRPDSLLWDYNLEETDRQMIVPAIPWYSYDGIPWNPLPLLGPAPDIHQYFTNHARYGRDYDVGFGGPRTDVSAEVPAHPPAAPPETNEAAAPSEG